MGPFFICNVAQSILRPLKRPTTQRSLKVSNCITRPQLVICDQDLTKINR
nr:MAG TPA: hypothetical protein [Caudoviricetes sp.]